jgi:hypothetical protein
MLCPMFMRGTTVVVFVTEKGIILSSDSKTTLHNSDFSKSAGEIEQEKFVVIQGRIVVIAIAVSDVKTDFGHYNFLTWMKSLQSQIPDHVSVDALADVIQKESASTFSKLGIADFVKTGAIENKTPADPCEMFTQFVIVGYQNGAPRVSKVYFYVDWNTRVFTGPVKTLLYPDSDTSNYRVIRFGTQQAIADFLNRESYAHEQASAACPKAMTSIRNRIYPSLNETICLSRVLIEVEKSTNPSDVGGAVRTIKILPSGEAEEVTAGTTVALPKPHSSANQTQKP